MSMHESSLSLILRRWSRQLPAMGVKRCGCTKPPSYNRCNLDKLLNTIIHRHLKVPNTRQKLEDSIPLNT